MKSIECLRRIGKKARLFLFDVLAGTDFKEEQNMLREFAERLLSKE